MKILYASQYQTACILVEEGDYDAEWLIERATQEGAFFDEGDGEECYVFQFQDRPPELYTRQAVERTCRQRERKAVNHE